MAGNRISMWRYRGKKRAAILAALSLYLIGGTGIVSAEDLDQEVKKSTQAIGVSLKEDADKTYDNVNLLVKGSSGGAKYEVTGISLKTGAQITVNGNFNLIVQNTSPAAIGKTFASGSDAAHYNMSGVYTGFGGGAYRTTMFTLNGVANIDTVGVALQANKDSQITLKGGTVRTRVVRTADTYAMLAEDGGKVFMNTGTNGNAPGTADVDVYGNLGVLNKNYGTKRG